jgi:hypothetical protein
MLRPEVTDPGFCNSPSIGVDGPSTTRPRPRGIRRKPHNGRPSARDEEATADDHGQLHLTVALGGGGPARSAVTIGGG